MLGLSLSKLLVLLGVISSVIAIFAAVTRIKRQRDELARLKAEAARRPPLHPAGQPRAAGPQPATATEELRPCPVCGTFYSAAAGRCGRRGCPGG